MQQYRFMRNNYSNFVTANQLQSTNVCESIELQCEDVMEKLHGMKLPSVGKFQSEIDKCQQKFHLRCVGPAEQAWKERLGKAENREFCRFSMRLQRIAILRTICNFFFIYCRFSILNQDMFF
eukprot:TRINITY_DN28120_c0_g1_i1.p2 TRINITY_DN28120_c0_g1~~TRINITY_DN28120_c0_g1_i1.p2  ORF type:complete len:122 (-),score=0.75 TRINITY_DN28120_c0_g1_i1:5-370(-)